VLRTSLLEYHLPPERIATRPAEPRESARLLVVNPSEPGLRHDRHVRDLPSLLRRGDLLVVNSSRVLPARLAGVKDATGGRVEGLYVEDSPRCESDEVIWTVLLKGGPFRPGLRINLMSETRDDAQAVRNETCVISLIEPSVALAGGWLARVEPRSRESHSGRESSLEILNRVGRTPLPPYILRARAAANEEVEEGTDRTWYQTVFADQPGSVAAPTAGLHLTKALIDQLKNEGVRFASVTLHVGLGTFKPIEAEFVEQHPMHREWCQMPAETQSLIEQTRSEGGRVVAVGTTAARTLESAWASEEKCRPLETNLLITPGYSWRCVDGLMTNFHLPRSTLLAMVAARLGTGEEAVRVLIDHYQHALHAGYRFYSYGDAMLVLPADR
jgi:S-adenosylmethionine:tRNA ribosyltransferase-isomerase